MKKIKGLNPQQRTEKLSVNPAVHDTCFKSGKIKGIERRQEGSFAVPKIQLACNAPCQIFTSCMAQIYVHR